MTQELMRQFVLSDEQLNEVKHRFLHNIRRGLARRTHPSSIVKCWVTYVQDLPTGRETGKFLALDLGGTNFRVLLIELKGAGNFGQESRIYAIPPHIMTGPGKQLFDHIAESLYNFVKEHNLTQERLLLGFTFSFPVQQIGLKKGILVAWTKGFTCSGVVGEEVVGMLNDAIYRRGGMNVEVAAILNDTTGTLMSCAWKSPTCRIGLIVGTGCNACYVERVEEVQMFDAPNNTKPYMIINCEWGAFGDDGSLDFVRTEFDEEIDKNSLNAGKQKFEKMISGMYLGEMVRLCIVRLTQNGTILRGAESITLNTREAFTSDFISEIESEKRGSYINVRSVMQKMGVNNVSDDDCANIRYICECVSRRSAFLVSCGLAGLLNKMNEPRVTIGVDGSLYRYHPKYHDLLIEKITEMVKPGIHFNLMLSEDGSGRGAALIAAVTAANSDSSEGPFMRLINILAEKIGSYIL